MYSAGPQIVFVLFMLCMYNKCVIFESSEQYMVQSFIISHHREKFLWTDFLILLHFTARRLYRIRRHRNDAGRHSGCDRHRHGHRSDHGAGKMSKHKIARWPASIYVKSFGGTPLFVQILILAYGVPYLVNTLSDGAMRFNWNPYFHGGYFWPADSTAALIWRKSSEAAFRRWTTVRRKRRGLWE